jgi:hypothetical protein
VAGYLLGEYSHLLARRPGCSPKEVFHIVHDKFPTVTYALNQCSLHLGCRVVHFSSSESKIYIFVCCVLSQEQHSALRLLAEKEVVTQVEQKSSLL